MDIDAALDELGMLSGVTEARKQYAHEKNRDCHLSTTVTDAGTSRFQIVKLNTEFVSSIGTVVGDSDENDNVKVASAGRGGVSTEEATTSIILPSTQHHLGNSCRHDVNSGQSVRCKKCHRSRVVWSLKKTRHFPYPMHRRCFTKSQHEPGAQRSRRRSCQYNLLGQKRPKVDVDQVSDTLEDLHVSSVGGQQQS